MTLPQAIADYLIMLATEHRDMAYLQVTEDGRVLHCGGQIDRYGLKTMKVGDKVSDHLFYLEGFFPSSEANEVMRYLTTEEGLTIDIHWMSQADQHWVLLLDSAAEMHRQEQLQQKANDLTLLRQAYAKLLNQHQYHPSPPSSAQSSVVTSTTQTISVLLVELCPSQNVLSQDKLSRIGTASDALSGSTAASTGKKLSMPPSTSDLSPLNNDFATISQVILEEGGLVHHILGQRAIAFFGLIPTAQPDPQEAAVTKSIRTANRLLRHFPARSEKDDTSAMTLGLGITTGEATMSPVEHAIVQTLNASGPAVSAAYQLREQLSPNSVLIDAATFQIFTTLEQPQATFQVEQSIMESSLYKLIPK